MDANHPVPRGRLLEDQLRRYILLRWAAGATAILGGLADWQWVKWYAIPERFALLGAAILAYNALLFALVRLGPRRAAGEAKPRSATWLTTVSWIQIVLDLACLTLLILWTGGARSPFVGFYVFHMVFATLLLPRRMGYGGAAVAMAMLGGGLWLSYQWPQQRGDWLILAGWAVSLLLIVYLTDHITQSLRHQHRRLVSQNQRISEMSGRLKEQHEAMVQHEKMVALGQMAAGVAHEIANPLACMDSLLEVMHRHPERKPAERIADLREQSRRIKQIIGQMTTFSRPLAPQGRRMGVNDTVEASLEMVQYDKRLSDVEIERRFSPGMARVQVELQGMQQVLVNLMLNALDAMQDVPQPRLTLSTARDGDWGRIEITDNGCGVAPEYLDRLFEPFFTTKPVGKGTGLGLATSYSLVQRLGGRIEVRSRPGEGATFCVRWPLHPAASYSREPDLL